MKNSAEQLTISSFYCHGENLFIQMETTAPPPKRKSRKKRGIRYLFMTLKHTLQSQQLYCWFSSEDKQEASNME